LQDDIEERCREFKRMVQKKMTPGQLQRAVQSQDYKRIYREVIDCYYSTTHLKSIGNIQGIFECGLDYLSLLKLRY
jgi:hypothetical protein